MIHPLRSCHDRWPCQGSFNYCDLLLSLSCPTRVSRACEFSEKLETRALARPIQTLSVEALFVKLYSSSVIGGRARRAGNGVACARSITQTTTGVEERRGSFRKS